MGLKISFHIVQYVTPVERDQLEVRHLYVVKRGHGLPGIAALLAARVMLKFALVNSDRDKPIWNHKSFKRSPVLSEGDAMLGRFRRWARRFYQDGEMNGNSREMQSWRCGVGASSDSDVVASR
jgi:hypothetical protein